MTRSAPATIRIADALASRGIGTQAASPPFAWSSDGSRVAAIACRLSPVVSTLAAIGGVLSRRPLLVAAGAIVAAPLAQVAGVPALSGTAFAVAGVALLCALARSLHEDADRRIVLAALVAGALLRVALGALLTAQGGLPDETNTYHPVASDAARSWRVGGASTMSANPIVAGRAAYFDLLAGAYALLGGTIAVGRVLGGFLGLAAALAAGEVGRAFAGRRAAAVSVAVLALHPEHALWSVTLSRDTLSTLLVLVTLGIVLRRPGRLLSGNLLLAAAPVVLLATNSFLVAGALAATLVAIALAEAISSRRLVIGLAAAAIAIAALVFVGRRYGAWFTPWNLELARLHGIGTKADFLPDFTFGGWDDVLAYAPLGAAFVLAAPWPWTAAHASRAAYGLVATAGLAVTILGIVGLVSSCRRRPGAAAPVFLFATILLALFAVLEGTAGIVVRHRLPLTACLAVGAGVLLAGLRRDGTRRP